VKVHAEEDADWLPATRMAPELGKRYEEAFGEDIDLAVQRINEAQSSAMAVS
jgi:hypothetical protein